MTDSDDRKIADNTADIDRARRRRRRKHRLRRFFGAVAALLLLAGLGASLAVYFHVDTGTWFGNLSAGLKKGSGFPVDTQYMTVLDLLPMESGVAVISTSGADLYNTAGAVTYSYRGRFISPVAKTAGGRLLMYDLSGNSLLVASRTEVLFSYQAKNGIFAADLTARGVFALAEGDAEYLSVVTAYNAVREQMFRWRTSECYVTTLALDRAGSHLAAAGVNPGGGTVSSTLRFFTLTESTQTAQVDFDGELVLSAVWNNDDRLQVLTDRALYLFDRSGSRIASAAYSGALQGYENASDGTIYLALGDYRAENGMTIAAYDDALQPLGEVSVGRKLLSMRLSGGRLFLLTEGQLLLADRTLSELKDRGVDDLFFVCPVDTHYYGITAEGLIREKL